MSGQPNRGGPPLVEAMQWVSKITTVSLEMVLPAALGFWLDQKWGTDPWLVVLGAVLGFTVSMMHLLQMVGVTGIKSRSDKRDKQP